MSFNKAFDDTVEVSLETGAVGNALQKGSDVKLNGVPVGRVTAIDNTSTGARLTLALDPDTAEALPVETTARRCPRPSSVSGTSSSCRRQTVPPRLASRPATASTRTARPRTASRPEEHTS